MKIDSLVGLLEQQDDAMRTLFAKAINLYVAPNSDGTLPKEKAERLKQFVEDSLR